MPMAVLDRVGHAIPTGINKIWFFCSFLPFFPRWRLTPWGKSFDPRASATAYSQRPKFVVAKQFASAKGENCGYSPTLANGLSKWRSFRTGADHQNVLDLPIFWHKLFHMKGTAQFMTNNFPKYNSRKFSTVPHRLPQSTGRVRELKLLPDMHPSTRASQGHQ